MFLFGGTNDVGEMLSLPQDVLDKIPSTLRPAAGFEVRMVDLRLMPAVIYARVSPRPDSGDDSIKTQVYQCEQWCLDNDIDIRSRHHEQDVSASEDRPGLWEAIDELRAGDTLVVYRLDRIARDVYLAESFHRQIAKKGAHVHAVQSGAVDDTPEGRMIRQILDVASEYERRVIGKRTSTAMQNHQLQRQTHESPCCLRVDG